MGGNYETHAIENCRFGLYFLVHSGLDYGGK